MIGYSRRSFLAMIAAATGAVSAAASFPTTTITAADPLQFGAGTLEVCGLTVVNFKIHGAIMNIGETVLIDGEKWHVSAVVRNSSNPFLFGGTLRKGDLRRP